MVKFWEMPYVHPDGQAAKQEMEDLTRQLKEAESYPQAREVFLEWEAHQGHLHTLATLASIRHSIDTRNEFYDREKQFWSDLSPELRRYTQAWNDALLASPFQPEFEGEFGSMMFWNSRLEKKAFAPQIVPLMQQENQLAQRYEKLLASAQIPFRGQTYTLSQLSPFKNHQDDALRLAAWQAEGQWYKDHQEELDSIYHQLVALRDEMGRKLGYDGYTQMGYYRMYRSYDRAQVEQFRAAVRKYLVPVAEKIFRAQAQANGFAYPMSFAEHALKFRSGNPKPQGDQAAIVAHGKKFYQELSPETGEFFNTMLEGQLMDLGSTPGKETGGYCTSLPDYKVPFIFACFNGTQHDVEVITHEAGHAFASWLNRDRVPASTVWPSLEACEVHSMSMEFFAWPWAEGFFGPDTQKFLYSHLVGSLTFIPYGTMVDHFQHEVYAHPEYTPAQRHGVWKELLGVYMPWLRLDGEIPFYSEGEGWQRQHHIYSAPFYYIDYCLAQTVALEFWAMIQKDPADAWAHYMAYTRQGGSQVFTQLLKNAGLDSPFEEECLKQVCDAACQWLEGQDLAALSR